MTLSHSETSDICSPRQLVGAAKCVLFDFDGPLCDLFADHLARRLARELTALLKARGVSLASGPDPGSMGPVEILREIANPAHSGHQYATETEVWLTEQEFHAVKSAKKTEGAHEFVRTLVAHDLPVAVTTNNSRDAVLRYIDLHHDSLGGCFDEKRIIGRNPDDLASMKPEPDCVLRAVKECGIPAEECLMIGDSYADVKAADRANVPFLGFAWKSSDTAPTTMAKRLRSAGARCVIGDLGELCNYVISRR